MSFYDSYFDLDYDGSKNVAVCCPFPHHTSSGLSYLEHNPSAHVDVDEGLFHCKVCDKGFNEVTFIMEILGCNITTANKLKSIYNNNEDIFEWDECNNTQHDAEVIAAQWNIKPEVVSELHLMAVGSNKLRFPAFMYDHLVDVRTYESHGSPKVCSRTGAPSGVIIPFDVWRASPKERTTLICAGEKDMAVARSYGFNAITITGGEHSVPLTANEFKDRKVVIVYDNDDAGKSGANKLAEYLLPYAKEVRVCTGFHSVCTENKEDITDFFVKYGKSKKDLIGFLNEAPVYEHTSEAVLKDYPILNLHKASNEEYVNKVVRSNIQVVAMSEATYLVPTTIIGEKVADATSRMTPPMMRGDSREWELNDNNIQDIMYLIDNNFTEKQIVDNCKHILKIFDKEPYISIKQYNKKPVFKCVVTDLFETSDGEVTPMEYTAYSIGVKLESGKKYMVTYKLSPHPYKGQQLIMLITNAFDANDTVTNFKVDEHTAELLKPFQVTTNVENKINESLDKVRGLVGFDCDINLIKAIDLSYHTVLGFNFNHFNNVRGYLDTFIVGESRVGKSSVANKLRETYQLGMFTSLAGTAATIPGLVGGSNKQNGTFQTRAGLIPQNHKGLIIFEEFGKSHNDVITELTDIRSSNEVRITRVSGTLTLPASVRMITLTNTKTLNGMIKPIATYPNGISVITELVGTAEDIARYDLLVVLGSRGAKHIDANWEAPTPYTLEQYRTRIRWIWSRTPEQIKFEDGVINYVIEKANALNDEYECHIKIFGTEAWKKIARLAIAVAGYVCSTDDSFENIIVTKEHVDYAVKTFIELYDNDVFKLREYVAHERRYSQIDEDGIAALQMIYNKSPALILHLEQVATTSKTTVQAATGLSNDDYNTLMNQLISDSFVQITKYDIVPTERFRKGLSGIVRKISVSKVGDNSVTV